MQGEGRGEAGGVDRGGRGCSRTPSRSAVLKPECMPKSPVTLLGHVSRLSVPKIQWGGGQRGCIPSKASGKVLLVVLVWEPHFRSYLQGEELL